jgi:hypothetical protein
VNEKYSALLWRTITGLSTSNLQKSDPGAVLVSMTPSPSRRLKSVSAKQPEYSASSNAEHLNKGVEGPFKKLGSLKRCAIVQAAMQVGIYGIEFCAAHIHLANRSKLCLWPNVDE